MRRRLRRCGALFYFSPPPNLCVFAALREVFLRFLGRSPSPEVSFGRECGVAHHPGRQRKVQWRLSTNGKLTGGSDNSSGNSSGKWLAGFILMSASAQPSKRRGSVAPVTSGEVNIQFISQPLLYDQTQFRQVLTA
jgi:hypothetical protein